MTGLAPPPDPSQPGAAPSAYRCGSLVYTRAGLFTLFIWLLWGDFCFSLMENIWPNVLPLMLKAQGASNTVLALTVTTIPSAMNFVLNPIISTVSDRYRGKRGRRIPFLLAATPFITLFLILLGFSSEFGRWLKSLLGESAGVSTAALTIGVICVLVICFRFFELFVNTVFWYLFNDVVPSAVMGRFVAFFRMVGAVAGALFNFFLYRHAESHTGLIFFGAAVLYGTVFLFMCLHVKEGSYPPPEPMRAGRRSPLAALGTFFRECFSHRIYRLVYAYSALFAAGNAINAFLVFLAFSIGLDLGAVGTILGAAAIASVIFMYPTGSLVDRFHPVRVMLVAQAGFCLAMAAKLVFLFHDFSREAAFWIFGAASLIAVPVTVANAAAGLPLVMRLFPRERFGQFCSANAMCASLGTMAGGALAGVFLDLLKARSAGDFYYRFVPLWSLGFMLLTVIATLLIYREWKRLGGDSGYRPPEEAGQGGWSNEGCGTPQRQHRLAKLEGDIAIGTNRHVPGHHRPA